MHHAHSPQVRFDFLPEVEIRAAFDGAAVTSDAGLLLVAQLEEEVGLLRSLAAVIDDPRQFSKCQHSALELLTQREWPWWLGMRTATTTPFSVAIQG